MKPNFQSGAEQARVLFLLIAICIASFPVQAQRRPTPRRATPEPQAAQPAVTLDTLLAADSYKIYGEVRNVGQLIRSEGVKDLLDPVMKLAAPPKEFKSLIKWLNTRADALTTSRLLLAAWPSRPKLPKTLVAIEFASAEEAQKFEPQLKDFLPKLLPAPTPESSHDQTQVRGQSSETKQSEKPAPPPYILKQVGSLICITDVQFALKDLRPMGSKLLMEDQNFRMVHDRFSSESVFLYLDVAAMEREESEHQKKAAEEQKRTESDLLKQQKSEEETANLTQQSEEQAQPENSPSPSSVAIGTADARVTITDESMATQSNTEKKPAEPDPMSMAWMSLSSLFFGSQPKWPDGVGAALAFEGDTYVARVLLINAPDEKINRPLPFFPQFVSGPALNLESPSILPSDTELFVSASLDFPQIYEGMVKAASAQLQQSQQSKLQAVKDTEAPSPFEVYEKRLGIKFKDDLLPLLGHEVAFTIPVKAFESGPATTQPSQPKSDTGGGKEKEAAPESPSPIFAIAVKDREAVRTLLPRIIDSIAVKGASMLAQTEKRDDTEFVSYGDMFAYALIGNFLVIGPDGKAVRHVVDSYLNHETLSSSNNFRNYTRWQPRQVLGQVYVSPALMESYNSFARDATAQISDQLRDFLMMVSPLPQPVTYAISYEGLGPLHELHVPKNLLMLMVAGLSRESNEPPLVRNESITRNAMRAIASAEASYQATTGDGKYGTLDELVKTGLISKELLQNYGYKIDLIVSNTRFEATAVPVEYGKTGKLSFFIDETSVLRAGDHAGSPASVADKP